MALPYSLHQLGSLPPDRTPVDRCVCHGITFARLIELQRETGATFDELQAMTGCSTGCGLCYPYVRAALATGIERFPVLSERELGELAE